MSLPFAEFKSNRFVRIAQILEDDRHEIIERWMDYAVKLQPNADGDRRQIMRDDLPDYLILFGHRIAKLAEGDIHNGQSGEEHGRQRWRVGWSLAEVVRDYQILRPVIVTYVSEKLESPLDSNEILAINYVLDSAVTGSVMGFVEQAESSLRDLNDNLEDQVVERTRQLRATSIALVNAEHRERRRVAQLLHNKMQQTLFAARMHLEKLLDEPSAEIRAEKVKLVDELVLSTIEESRSLSSRLDPPVLYERGLVAAIEYLTDVMKKQYELDVELTVETTSEPSAPEIRHFAYHAIQELMLNVVKHSGTEACTIALDSPKPSLFRVTVWDNGKGPAENLTAGVGLADIRHRVDALGGEFAVEPVDAGFRVKFAVPMRLSDVEVSG